jgi:hypothetical protein
MAAVALGSVGCVVPQGRAVLPKGRHSGSYVAVVSGQFYPPLEEVSRSAWLLVHRASQSSFQRYENGNTGGTTSPYEGYGGGDVMVHGAVAYSEEELAEKETCLREASGAYRTEVGSYRMFPGPNANTYVAFLLRRCGIHIELPSTAIGKDYVGWVGAGRTESGTGVVLGTVPLALRLGLKEGFEVQLFALPFGVHFWPPGITVPVNPGRIGFSTDRHEQTDLVADSKVVTDGDDVGPPTTAVASVQMLARARVAPRPSRVDGFRGAGAVGMSARGLYGGRLGYGVGLEFDLGISAPVGFAATAHAFPVGVGYTISPTGFVGIFSGIGTSGTTNRVPFGLDLPQELRLEVDAGSRARLIVRAQAIPVSPPGEPWRLDFALGTYARFAHLRSYESLAFGSGYFFGVEQRVIHGDAIWGLVFGTEIALGAGRAPRAEPKKRPPLPMVRDLAPASGDRP